MIQESQSSYSNWFLGSIKPFFKWQQKKPNLQLVTESAILELSRNIFWNSRSIPFVYEGVLTKYLILFDIVYRDSLMLVLQNIGIHTLIIGHY